MSVLPLVIGLLLLGLTDARSTKNGHLRRKRAITKYSDEVLTSMSGNFKSPNYPSSYPLDVEKTYIIEFPDPQGYYKVTFNVKVLGIELQSSCSWDYLLINAGGIGKLCGSKTNQVYTVDEQQGSVTAKFYSDYMVNDKGFDIDYTLEKLGDGCSSSPCNNGTCQANGRTDFTCSCYSGYTGSHCDLLLGSCITNDDCGYHGECDFYDCACTDGFTGMHCDNPPSCTNDYDCGSHGYCQNYSCSCTDGYMGDQCNVTCVDDTDCNGHGNCYSGLCSCYNGYAGVTCSQARDCTYDTECGNHGYCSNYTCICTDFYMGTHCDIACSDDSDCGYHGYCMDSSCYCHDGYSGDKCENASVCLTYEDCNYYGYCSNNTCNCYEYGKRTGANCEIENDCSRDYHCGDHGMCSFYYCSCYDGYSGRFCEIAPGCQNDSDCSLGETCIYGNCTLNCSDGYYGNNCEFETTCMSDADCQNGGFCSNSQCDCWGGYTGQYCERELNTNTNSNSGSNSTALPSYDLQKVFDLLQLAKSKSTSSKNKMQHVQEVLKMAEQYARN